jgi:hypothetical protein
VPPLAHRTRYLSLLRDFIQPPLLNWTVATGTVRRASTCPKWRQSKLARTRLPAAQRDSAAQPWWGFPWRTIWRLKFPRDCWAWHGPNPLPWTRPGPRGRHSWKTRRPADWNRNRNRIQTKVNAWVPRPSWCDVPSFSRPVNCMVFAVVAPDEVVAPNGSKEYCICTVPDVRAGERLVDARPVSRSQARPSHG